MKTAIIGGGITGLAAAYHLVKRGVRPVIFEPGPFGGMIRSVLRDGFTLEQGPNVLVERPDIVSLLGDLGLQHRVRYPSVEPYGQYVWFRGRPTKVPAGLGELLRSPLFSTRTKLALPMRILLPGTLATPSPDLSVLDFFSPLLGRATVQALLDPVLKGIYGGDVGRLSARMIFPGLWGACSKGDSIMSYLRKRPKGGKPRIFGIEGGIQSIAAALVEFLQGKADFVRQPVESITQSAGGFEIRCKDGHRLLSDSCVVTTAGATTASFVGHVSPTLAQRLTQVEFAGLTVVHCALDRTESLIPGAFGVLFPGGMPDNFLGIMFNSVIFPHVAPADKHLVTLVLGGAQAGSAAPDLGRLREALPRLLHSLLGIKKVEWLDAYAWRGAIPQLQVGYSEIVGALDAAESSSPGLVFAGVDRGGVGVSDRLRIARESVEKLVSTDLPRVALA